MSVKPSNPLRFLMIVRDGGVGGVTSSVRNLSEALREQGHQVERFKYASLLRRYDVVHVHLSNLRAALGAILLGRIIGRNVVFTVHNGRMDAGSDPYARWICRIGSRLIFLNEEVYGRNRPFLGKRTASTLMTSLLAGRASVTTREAAEDGHYRVLLYAYRRNFAHGHEIYGIEWLAANLDLFPSDYRFTVADPTGDYVGYLPDTPRIHHITHPIDFLAALGEHDLYLRPTSTDGQSVAVLEALMTGTPVVASDAVPRPEGCHLYRFGDAAECVRVCEAARNAAPPERPRLSTIEEYLTLVTGSHHSPNQS